MVPCSSLEAVLVHPKAHHTKWKPALRTRHRGTELTVDTGFSACDSSDRPGGPAWPWTNHPRGCSSSCALQRQIAVEMAGPSRIMDDCAVGRARRDRLQDVPRSIAAATSPLSGPTAILFRVGQPSNTMHIFTTYIFKRYILQIDSLEPSIGISSER
jgi:hypothetical protein